MWHKRYDTSDMRVESPLRRGEIWWQSRQVKLKDKEDYELWIM